MDHLVVELPEGRSNLTGEMATELVALAEAGTIRVVDMVVLTTAAEGEVDAMELSAAMDRGAPPVS